MRVSYIPSWGINKPFAKKCSVPLTLGGLSLCIEIMPRTTSQEGPSVAEVRLNASGPLRPDSRVLLLPS